jgi:hypothetical protein
VGSNTAIGTLIAGFNNANVYSAAGRVVLDGAGNVYASPTPGLLSNILVGGYTVNTDCSLTMTLYDPFSTATTATGITGTGTTSTTPTITGQKSGLATLQGFISNSGQEVDLIATITNAAGATLTLTKMGQFSSCTNATVSGSYSIAGAGAYLASAGSGIVNVGTNTGTTSTGAGTTATGTTTTSGTGPIPGTTPGTYAGAFQPGATTSLGVAFNLLGRFVADGNGNFVADSASLTSPLSAGISGAYLVNADCTGTARLQDKNGVTRDISFVLVNTAAQGSVGAIPQSSAVQQLQFVFSDPGVFGSGAATPQ